MAQTNTASENYDKIVISKKRKWFSRIMLFIILIFVGCMLFTGNITVEIKEKSLKVGYHLLFSGSTEIEYEDIKKISYEKELDIGSRNFGVGSPKIMAGTFENETFEEYKLYSYTNCDYYIVIQTNDGYVVVNDETEETTRKLYDELKHEIDRSKN